MGKHERTGWGFDERQDQQESRGKVDYFGSGERDRTKLNCIEGAWWADAPPFYFLLCLTCAQMKSARKSSRPRVLHLSSLLFLSLYLASPPSRRCWGHVVPLLAQESWVSHPPVKINQAPGTLKSGRTETGECTHILLAFSTPSHQSLGIFCASTCYVARERQDHGQDPDTNGTFMSYDS